MNEQVRLQAFESELAEACASGSDERVAEVTKRYNAARRKIGGNAAIGSDTDNNTGDTENTSPARSKTKPTAKSTPAKAKPNSGSDRNATTTKTGATS